MRQDLRATHLWLEAGASGPLAAGPEPTALRAVTRCLMAVGICAAFAMIAMVTDSRTRAVEATAWMEQLATDLDRAAGLTSQTVDKLARTIRQPWYDCRHVACDPELEARNLAARSRLQQALAHHGFATELAVSSSRERPAAPSI
jgi:hypothetical protein